MLYVCLEIYMYIHIMINVCYFVLCLMTIQILDFRSIKSLTLTLTDSLSNRIQAHIKTSQAVGNE